MILYTYNKVIVILNQQLYIDKNNFHIFILNIAASSVTRKQILVRLKVLLLKDLNLFEINWKK